jgi:hypothetical protein
MENNIITEKIDYIAKRVDIVSTVLYHRGQQNHYEITFNLSNSYFVLIETFMIIAYTSLIPKVPSIYFEIPLFAGFLFSILCIWINIEFSKRYLGENNTLARTFSGLTNFNQKVWEEKTIEQIRREIYFWPFSITQLFFGILFMSLIFYSTYQRII